jgi:hypothetical protein
LLRDDLTIIDLSEEEHKYVVSAKDKYGLFFENADATIRLLSTFLKSVEPDCWCFVCFLSQVRKYALLSFLSIIRQHNSQAMMDMRQLFESGVIAAYSLGNTDDQIIENAFKSDMLKESEKLKEKAYSWIAENYKEQSDIIKKQKDKINENWAHSNIVNASENFCLSEDRKFKTLVFDKEIIVFSESYLWILANSCWGLLALYSKIIKNVKRAELCDDFDYRMRELGDENFQLQQILIANKRGVSNRGVRA